MTRGMSWKGVATAPAEDAQNPDAVEPDAEVSFVTRDLGQVLPKAKIAGSIAPDEILMRVRDAANWKGNSGVRYASANIGDIGGDMKLGYAPEGPSADPYAGFETRIVPERFCSSMAAFTAPHDS